MKEKIKNFFQNERVKILCGKLFNKKTFKGAVAIIIIVVALRVTFSILFEVHGVVQKVQGNNITVANFFTTQTINTENYPVDSTIIKVGDKIEITKNIQGQVLYIKDKNLKNSIHEKNQFDDKIDKRSFKEKH